MAKSSAKTRRRTDSVYGTVNVTNGTLTVQYDPRRDEIEIVGADHGSTKTERSYQRASGKAKVVSSIPTNGPSAFTAQRAVWSYERILAVDTNHRLIGGKLCAVCCSYYVPGPPASYSDAIPWLPLGAFLIYGISSAINPERIGWHVTLTRYLNQIYPGSGTIALVVDSELDLHRAINNRKTAYYGNHLLPPNVNLIYSSSDTDKDTLQGVMIRACDALSKQIFDELLKLPLLAVTRNGTDPNFETCLPIRSTHGSLPLEF